MRPKNAESTSLLKSFVQSFKELEEFKYIP